MELIGKFGKNNDLKSSIGLSDLGQQFWQHLLLKELFRCKHLPRAHDEQLIVRIAHQNQQLKLNHARWITTSTRWNSFTSE
jgi:hypothetical protein